MSFLMRRTAVATAGAVTGPVAASARAFSSSASRAVARITIIGHLGETPQVQSTSNGRDLLKYNVASTSGPRDKRQTSWFRVASFLPPGAQRDLLTSLPKGTLVYIEGDATMNSFQDAQGKTQTALNVLQRSIEVLRRPANTESAGEEEEGQSAFGREF